MELTPLFTIIPLDKAISCTISRDTGRPWIFEHNSPVKQTDFPTQSPAVFSERGGSISRGRAKQTRGRNLLNHLTEHQDYILAFAKFEDIPFTNNLAERDLRPAKIKQKVSGCFRTFTGAERFAHIRSFISTARKQSRNVFKELVHATNGQSFVLQLVPVGS